jgi:hypothetical protein
VPSTGTCREATREDNDYKLGLAKVAANKTEYAVIKPLRMDTFILKVISAAAAA